ncbi:MAG: hypothetical protein JW795_17550 [Chitinivibrionales bacterium]|nr:hypothetical protein [Chitinivibrionales bacterium]
MIITSTATSSSVESCRSDTIKTGFSGCILATVLLSLLLFSCSPQMSRSTIMETTQTPITTIPGKDTTTYFIRLSTQDDAKLFLHKFNKFLKEYTFDTVYADTLNRVFFLHVITQRYPFDQQGVKEGASGNQRPLFFEESVELEKSQSKEEAAQGSAVPSSALETAAVPPPPVEITRGGSITIYSSRKSVEDITAGFYKTIPIKLLTDNNSGQSQSDVDYYYLMRPVASRRIEVQCTDAVRNCQTKSAITAFDIIRGWSEYIRANPAEGSALFSHVQGINGFIKGEEAIIPGFRVVNDKTINITLDADDPHSLERLSTTRLLNQPNSLSRFVKIYDSREKVVLRSNACYPADSLLIDSLVLVFEDKNPLVSFSLNKYDMCLLTGKKELDYAKRSLGSSASIIPFSEDRYFLAIQTPDKQMRQLLKKSINPTDILANAVRAEGSLITALETDDDAFFADSQTFAAGSPASRELRLLYSTADPVSVTIAEKIFSGLSSAGITVMLIAAAGTEYQKLLVEKKYDCTIGWARRAVQTDKAEQLRLAAIWFNNERDESLRLSQLQEIPLFAVKRFALCKQYVQFYNGSFAGMYRQLQ